MNTHRIILSRFLMAIFFLWKCPVIFYTIFSSILGHSSTVMYRVSQVRIYGIHSQRLETIHSYLIILVNNSIHQVVKTLLKNEEHLLKFRFFDSLLIAFTFCVASVNAFHSFSCLSRSPHICQPSQELKSQCRFLLALFWRGAVPKAVLRILSSSFQKKCLIVRHDDKFSPMPFFWWTVVSLSRKC